ncbi:aminotransferase class I/II-fold pyridoxal phosphate-dependent enzyme [Sulfurimonas sp.]|uniref:aminotransferase class I/II-fold pyridoxal phosphate-dependent enzyme n=1 Tax=Sulfurimonas sp. TaxID=2022749 RepID=UPI001A0B5BFF|nr:aminotransferase class I/II-fold pyridoxal phosphate-dependent enzyme [Sulfurimonas sp.]MBE0514911.1 aminotransferase class I/II-fold pyridoxal phosphate-dependent enzyme [Sulfurimonas sp.]
MQAIILAAGTGSRLGKHTKENTKCMLEINGITLIDQVLEKLNNAGITKLILVVGYKKDNLINHVGSKYKNINIEYIENPIYDKTNNIYSLYLAKEKLQEDDTLLLESDLIFDESILTRLLADKRKSLAVVDKYKSWMDGTSVILDNEDYITGFHGKKAFRFQNVQEYYKTVNIYKFSKEFSNKTYVPFLEAYSKVKGDNEYYESVLNILTILDGHELRAMRLEGEKWYEIDDVQDKANAEIIFAKTPKEKLSFIQKRFGGYWRFPEIKDFCYLVNPYFPPSKMQEEMKAFFYDLLSQYPSGLNTQNLLAGKMFGIESENILVGNGAAEIIRGIGNVLDGTFGIVFPTFNEYPESIGYDRIVKFIPNNESFSYEIDDLKKLVDKSDNLILINPDNPSGHFNNKSALIELIRYAHDKNKYFIVDESFVDFAKNGEKETLINQDFIDAYPNLVIIKSISKSYGVPGIRLGIAASSNIELLKKFRKEISIWNINSFGEYFLQIIGKYKNDYQTACELIREERDRFWEELKSISFLKVYKSEANYFLCQVIDFYTATKLSEKLIENNIYIKDLTGKIGFEEKEYIRIAVRDSQDNNRLITELKNMDIK